MKKIKLLFSLLLIVLFFTAYKKEDDRKIIQVPSIDFISNCFIDNQKTVVIDTAIAAEALQKPGVTMQKANEVATEYISPFSFQIKKPDSKAISIVNNNTKPLPTITN